MPQFRYVGMHADTVKNGELSIPVAPGDYVTVPQEDNEAMVEEGLLIPIAESVFKAVENV